MDSIASACSPRCCVTRSSKDPMRSSMASKTTGTVDSLFTDNSVTFVDMNLITNRFSE